MARTGSAYVAGSTNSIDFPTNPGAYRRDPLGVFAAKLRADGSGLVYSTYLTYDVRSIAVDGDGRLFLAGGGLPLNNALEGWGGDLVRLNAAGSAVDYSVGLGAMTFGVALDAAGTAFVAGGADQSGQLRTVNALQPTSAGGYDAFVAKVAHVPPRAPTALRGAAASPYRIDLAWDDATVGESVFEIERRTDAGAFARVGASGPNIASFSDTGLEQDAAYTACVP